MRNYAIGSQVKLTAEPTFGDFRFSAWFNDRGERLSDNPSLTLMLSGNTQVQATYESGDERLAGDANGDGEVGFDDFLALSSNFGRSRDVVFADGDFDLSGTVDFADFLILSKNFGR